MSNVSTLLANSIISRFPNPADIPYRPWCYVQGYVLIGFEKLWLSTGEAKYFEYLRKFADLYVQPDGSLLGFTGESLDDIMAGTVVVALFEHTGELKFRRAAERIRASFANYPRNSDGGFWHSRTLPYEMWIDGLFMGGMFLTRYGAVIGEQEACFAEVAHQVIALASHCSKGKTGLFLHAYDEARHAPWADPVTGLSPEVWSEGLGWYALILAETLALMPPDHPDLPAIIAIFQELVEGLKRVQDAQSGLWYQVVDKGDRPDNWQDTSGSGMFLYAIQRAIDLGFVSREEFEPIVQRGYQGLLTHVEIRPDGLVDVHQACDGVCVQRSYADYVNYPRVVNAKEAVGSVLWAAVAVEKPGATGSD
jgi:rhamnogalacturonyl hydrolase YesR